MKRKEFNELRTKDTITLKKLATIIVLKSSKFYLLIEFKSLPYEFKIGSPD